MMTMTDDDEHRDDERDGHDYEHCDDDEHDDGDCDNFRQ